MPVKSTMVAAFMTMLICCSASFGQVEKVLYSFLGGTDGANPDAALVADEAGNLYGSAGTYPSGNGLVYELSPPATPGGAWAKTVIHEFAGSPGDGDGPGPLTFDRSGNLFGVTGYGGENGSGTVFELSPPAVAGGAWIETVLYNFPKGYSHGNGELPGGRLTFDGAGNLYGSAAGGIGDCFSNGCGVIFQIKRPTTPGSTWRGRVIYDFGQYSGDASSPASGFIFRSGSLYGVSYWGGAHGQGTLFKLSQTSGVWSETILYSFTGTEASAPAGNLIADANGNFYTSSFGGGKFGFGAVVQLVPPSVAGDPWTATNLHSFSYGDDGGVPQGGVIRDNDNNLYGTDTYGAAGDFGTVFKLIPPSVAGGAWTERTLFTFGNHPYRDGAEPYVGLIFIKGRGLFGTTHYGGASFNGTVFNLKP